MNFLAEFKKTRIYWALTVALFLGVGCLLIDQGLKRKWFMFGEPWAAFPWQALGEGFVTAFVVGLIYEGFVRKQTEIQLKDVIASALENERSSVLSSLTTDAVTSLEALERLSPEELKAATIRVLAARFGDEQLAKDVSETLIPQSNPNIEVTKDFQTRVHFLPDEDLPDEPGRFFSARISVSYERRLRRDSFSFAVTDSNATLASRIGEPGPWDVVWHSNNMSRYAFDNPATYAVEYVRVNDIDLDREVSIVAAKDRLGADAQLRVQRFFSTAIELLVGQDVRIDYTVTTKVPKLGHLLYMPLTQTCHGVRYEFDLGQVGIEKATVVPFFLSAARPLVREDRFKDHVVWTAATSSWVLPGGGIVVTWRLVEELSEPFQSRVFGKA